MAEAATIGLQDEVVKDTFLTCSICLERFNSPKILPCLHTFCLLCLDGYMEKTSKDEEFLCPCCRLVTKVPSTGAAEFRTNFFMNSLVDFFWGEGAHYTCAICSLESKTIPAVSKCMDCVDYLCAECSSVHCRSRLTLKHNIVTLEINNDDSLTVKKATGSFPCLEHPEKVQDYFCTVCEKTVCEDCKDLSHHDHSCVTFQEALKERRPILQEKIHWLTEQCQKIELNLGGLEKYRANVQQEHDVFVEEMELIFQEISELRSQALQDAKKNSELLLKQNGLALDENRARLAQLHSYKEYLNTATERAADVEILDSFKMTNGHIENLRKEGTTSTIHIPGVNVGRDPYSSSANVQQFLSGCKKCLEDAQKSITLKEKKRVLDLAPKSVQKIPNPGDKVCSGLTLSQDGSIYACSGGKVYHYSKGWEDISSELGVRKGIVDAYDVVLGGDTLFVSTVYPDGNKSRCRLVIYNIVTKTFTLGDMDIYTKFPGICLKQNSSSVYVVGNSIVHEVRRNGCVVNSTNSSVMYHQKRYVTECEGNVFASSSSAIYQFNRDLKPATCPELKFFTSAADLEADGMGSMYVASGNVVYRISSDGLSYQAVLCGRDGILAPGPLSTTSDKLAVGHQHGVWIYKLE